MARFCYVSSKGPLSGHNVSHANNKTARVFNPNLHRVKLDVPGLAHAVRLRLSAAGLRTLDKYGGLDGFLRKVPCRKLQGPLLRMKKDLLKRQET